MNEKEAFSLADECVHLCEQLTSCFRQERVSLVEFKMDELLQNNLQKESLLASLVEKRQSLREKIDPKLTETLRWHDKKREWLRVWNVMRILCEENQLFIRHSLRNMSLIVEHLKSLLGEQSLYSPKGTRVDLRRQGKVVEARF